MTLRACPALLTPPHFSELLPAPRDTRAVVTHHFQHPEGPPLKGEQLGAGEKAAGFSPLCFTLTTSKRCLALSLGSPSCAGSPAVPPSLR